MQDSPTIHKFTLQTLGCKLNYAETSELAKQFVARGFEQGKLSQATEVFVLNTCSVTENAEKECRQVIRRVRRSAPNAFIAITGCYAQLRPEQIASIDGVDAVFGAQEKFELFERLHSFEKLPTPLVLVRDISEANEFHIASSSFDGDRTRAFLKVQDGCDYTCSFCTIPQARGASRSSSIESILHEARSLSNLGFREIVLSGVNVGDFGRKDGLSFYELLLAIESDEEITSRIRISSIEPNLLTDEIIELTAKNEKICPHFHVPLQSGSPEVLRRMQRRYTPEVYRERIEKILREMPHAAIGVDVIVGFPGETDQEFEATYRFLAELEIAYLHVFTYSERPETKALSIAGAVPQQVRKARNSRLRILSEKKKRSYYSGESGRVVTVLLESGGEGCSPASGAREGWSENYVRANVPEASAQDELVRVRLGEMVGDTVTCKLIEVISRRTEASSLLPILQLAG
jgi:threonylcarbamoyladenosine tRNA methylthiotransferase MtaB